MGDVIIVNRGSTAVGVPPVRDAKGVLIPGGPVTGALETGNNKVTKEWFDGAMQHRVFAGHFKEDVVLTHPTLGHALPGKGKRLEAIDVKPTAPEKPAKEAKPAGDGKPAGEGKPAA